MNCFDHYSVVASGSCNACGKGLCPDCAVQTQFGLACKDRCETAVIELGEMNERSKKIYGIGKYYSKVPSSGVLLWGAFSIIFWALTGISYYQTGEINPSLATPAVLVSILLGFTWYSARRTGLNC